MNPGIYGIVDAIASTMFFRAVSPVVAIPGSFEERF
jgi:hypothetical protein